MKKTINDDAKLTLTYSQLKKLVKESYNAYQNHDVKQLRVDFAKWLDEEDYYNEDDQEALLVLFDYYKSGRIDLSEAHRKFFDIYRSAKVAYNKFDELDQRFDREYNKMIGDGQYDDLIDEGAEFDDDDDEETPSLEDFASQYINGAIDSDAGDDVCMKIISDIFPDHDVRNRANKLIEALENAREAVFELQRARSARNKGRNRPLAPNRKWATPIKK